MLLANDVRRPDRVETIVDLLRTRKAKPSRYNLRQEPVARNCRVVGRSSRSLCTPSELRQLLSPVVEQLMNGPDCWKQELVAASDTVSCLWTAERAP